MTKNNTSSPYYSYRTFLREHYGGSLFRIPVNLGFGCPNRNPDGTGGCFFCGEDAALAVHLSKEDSLKQQVQSGIQYIRKRYGNVDLMLYMQAYTSTFADSAKIRKIYEQLLQMHDFRAVTVGTRPDCLPKETLQYFSELSKRFDFRVELGIQTVHDKTLKAINRGHDFQTSADAVKRLNKAGISVDAHIMIGLPGEARKEFNKTAETLAQMPIGGLKIHNLHIVKGTRFAEFYRNGKIDVMDEHEYGEALIDFIRRTPNNRPLIRICSDTPDNILIAPKWWMKKGQFIDYIYHQMQKRNLHQGDLLDNSLTANPDSGASYEAVKTDDGSFTLFNPFFKENFHTSAGAVSEAEKKFIEPSGLKKLLLEKKDVKILDVGFGLGLNALVATGCAKGSNNFLSIVSLEFDKTVVKSAVKLYPQWEKIYKNLLDKNIYKEKHFALQIYWGDARKTIKTLTQDKKFDIIFLDPFSTQKNPELWTIDFIENLKKCIKKDGVLLTYSNAPAVRAALNKANMVLGETIPFGRTKGGTIASPDKKQIKNPLDTKNMRIITETTSSIPYRDPNGTLSGTKILQNREKEVYEMRRKGMPKKIING